MAEQHSPEQLAGAHATVYEAMYNALDPDGSNVVQAGAAVTFMKQSKLDNPTLGKIWDIADVGAKGHLDRHGCYVALKLISAAQNGQAVSVSSLEHSLPPPDIAGFAPSAPASGRTSKADSVVSVTSPIHVPTPPPTVAAAAAAEPQWAISEDDQQKYADIFSSLEPENGLLSGATVRPVLLNSGLATDVLGKIWTLSDLNADGFLDLEEFSIAMHLVYACLKGQPAPGVLPEELLPPSKRSRKTSGPSRPRPPSCEPQSGGPPAAPIDQQPAARRTSLPIGFERDQDNNDEPAIQADQAGDSASAVRKTVSTHRMSTEHASPVASPRPAPPVAPPSGPSTPVRKLSAAAAPPQVVSGASSPVPAAAAKPAPVVLWPVDMDKHRSLFQQVDTDGDGWVNGNDVKGVLMQSGLPTSMLAQVWSLVDIRQTGALNQQQFALIMHLIEEKNERNVDPPAVLPPSLIPPSLRSTEQAAAVTTDAEIASLSVDIEALNEEKKGVDEAIAQLQADMHVKQAEIKNLEVESTTLDTTVKQLERQKNEAGRRLNDLDLQREALERTLTEMQQLLERDRQEVETIKADATNMSQSVAEQESALASKRQELEQVEAEERQVRDALQHEQTRLDGLHTANNDVERTVREGEYTVNTLRTQTGQLQSMLANLQQVLDANDVQQLYARQNELVYGLQQFTADATLVEMFHSLSVQSMKDKAKSPSTAGTPTTAAAATDAFPTADAFSSAAQQQPSTADVSDPFAEAPVSAAFPTDDAFHEGGGEFGEPTAAADPFAAADEDPFAGAAAQPNAENETSPDNNVGAENESAEQGPEPEKPETNVAKAEELEAETAEDADPFGGDAFGDGKAVFPTDGSDPFNDGAPSSGTGKADDPFGAPAAAGGGAAAFANFADFGAFK